jgi:alkanesulfonate monooxygenase SsuD/methylene tetrahydromethanopterin reductase-like flavin-dependent oxidoreductase (luciferase family)
MKFGLFGGAKRPLGEHSGDSLSYRTYIDYVLAAERLGFHSAFIVEHHFTGFGQVSAAINMLTYIAAKTSTIRLGTAVVVLPWHNPVLLAEQIATLDLLSDGRLDLGVGRGYRPNEFHGFDIDPGDEANERYAECLDILKTSWKSRDRFSHDGKFWSFRDVVVEPEPTQLPHPPLWVGAGSEGSIRRAARDGHRLMVDQFGTLEMTCRRVEWYRDELEAMGEPFDPANVIAARHLMLYRDEDIEQLPAEIDNRLAGIARLRDAARAPGDDRELTTEDHAFYDTERAHTEDAIIGGTAAEAIVRLKTLEAAGVGQVIFIDPVGGESRLEHFAEAVMPAFAD